MKILSLTAGAASMYCGSCLRDNALAAELKRQGHDVILLPIYTPTKTDEPNVSDPRIFLGGISVYLEQHSALFRNTPSLLDRLWDSHWALKLASRRSLPLDGQFLGAMTVSMLRAEDGYQRKEVQKLTRWLSAEAPPDVVMLPNSLLIGLARPVREVLKRPVLCTLQGEELFLSTLGEPYQSTALDLIRSRVEQVDGFVAVSQFCGDAMSRLLRIPASKMYVAPLGINLEGYEPAVHSPTHGFTVGYFARVAPEKGLHLLAEAYIRLRRETSFDGRRLEVAGYLAPEHRAYLQDIERRIAEAGFRAEFHYHGELDRAGKIEFLRNLNVLSVPATYDEPKGISVLEAMACGVPVVQPRRGAFPEMIKKAGGGILVAPDDPASLAEGIYQLWSEPEFAAELGRRGRQGVREHHSVAQMAARVLEICGQVTNARVHA